MRTRRTLAKYVAGLVLAGAVAASAVLPAALTGTPLPGSAGDRVVTSPVGLAVDALVHSGEPQVPAGFGPAMGYLPVASSAPEAPWIDPHGGCSFVTGATPYGFAAACQAHDLGYDLLRYAADTGQPLGPSARLAIDQRFAAALRQRCADIHGGPGCRAAARTYVAGVRFNSWRQSDEVPGRETFRQWLDHLGRALLR